MCISFSRKSFGLSVLILSSPVYADTLLVPDQFLTIQDAIDAAVDGDTVLVGAGTYAEHINFRGLDIHLVSEDGPQVTIIDGGGVGSVVRMESGEGTGAILEGFTITGGAGSNVPGYLETCGGGILLRGSVSPVIRGNIITGNIGAELGGGIGQCNTVVAGNPTIINNIISSNSFEGIRLIGSRSVVIENNTFDLNIGDGALTQSVPTVTMVGNTATNNTYDGLGVWDGQEAFVTGNLSEGNGEDGFLVRDTVMATLQDNFSIDNDGHGFHMWSDEGTVVLIDNVASGSSDHGMQLRSLAKAEIIGNKVFSSGNHNIRGFQVGEVSITNSVVARSSGVGIYMWSVGDFKVTNSTIYGNSSDGLLTRGNDAFEVSNSVVWGNQGDSIFMLFSGAEPVVSSSTIEGGYTGIGNISSDPLFVDSSADDFRLTASSSSIDAGDNTVVPVGITTDIAGNPRFADDPLTADTGIGSSPIVDMGAYEFVNVGCSIADLNADGVLDFFDISEFLNLFSASDSTADFNNDGMLDFFDISAFLNVFSAGCP